MRRSIATISVSLASIIAIYGCNQPTNKNTAPVVASMPANGVVSGARIAYVNMDTLEARYNYLKTKQEELKQRQEQADNELQRSFQEMQNDAQAVQKKAEANTLTQPEYEAAQKRLNMKQQTLQTRKESLTDQLLKEQEEISKDLKTRLNNFLADYNKNHNYDYILSYSYAGSPLLYVNPQYDITKDVVDGMNAASKNDQAKKSK